ncbi:hypothetical protein IFM89_009406 [Coptis chinensis]|uniref:Uncharacterized protein n=1 Tax=Coptis chinensis TaxID=261450 RepID=A0A835GVN6_9MAGN|nr:hypothetical protein IFM89_009406 [Coptis chinensis]
MACRSINLTCPLETSIQVCSFTKSFSHGFPANDKGKMPRICVKCSAVQESSPSIATAETKETKAATKAAPTKPTPPAKVPAKTLTQLMEEDVIPSLSTTFEAQNDLSEIELSFGDNRLEGSFVKNATRYSFWVFFPDGVLTGRLFSYVGPKGFSLSSYGSEVSTVEPFLIDEKKITGKHVVFWVEKRLAAQGILPVWKE